MRDGRIVIVVKQAIILTYDTLCQAMGNMSSIPMTDKETAAEHFLRRGNIAVLKFNTEQK